MRNGDDNRKAASRMPASGGAPLPRVSIIVPLHWGLQPENFPVFCRDLERFLDLDYRDYEILVVSDRAVELPVASDRIRQLVTPAGLPTPPTVKRDLALAQATGEICAFIDDDAYPDRMWLKHAVNYLTDPTVIGVGGPGLTPPEDSFWQQVGGAIIASYLCSGPLRRRFQPAPAGDTDDHPAYNLLLRRSALQAVGGFNSPYYGGEDTHVCLRLLARGRIRYAPEVVVYHHRRAFPFAHLRQIANVGLHRGYFARCFPRTSRRLLYFMPMLLVAAAVFMGGLAAWQPQRFLPVATAALAAYWTVGVIALHRSGAAVAVLGGIGIVLTHLVYGVMFCKGLCTRRLLR